MAVQIDILDRPIQVEIRSAIPVTISGQFGGVGPRGPTGAPGQQSVYVQETQPESSGPYIWVQTGLPNNGFTFWFEDGQ